MIWAADGQRRRPYLVDDNYDFVEPVKQYMDYLVGLGRSPNTVESYCRHLRLFFTFLGQVNQDWSQVKPDDLVEFIVWLRNPTGIAQVVALGGESPRGEKTINTIITVVSSFYRYQIMRGASITNPVVYESISNRFIDFKPFLVHTSRGRTMKRSLKLKEPKKKIKFVDEATFVKFLESPKNVQFQSAVWLMYQGGLRSSEVLGLHIQDVDFAKNGVWVRRRDNNENGALAKGMEEGDERFVDLTVEVMALLDKVLMSHTFDTDHLFVVLKKNAKDRLGSSTYGKPLNRYALKSMIRHYSSKADMRIHAHMFRHGHATELIKAGWDVSEVQKRLGHKNVHSTLIYTHLDDEHLSAKWKKYAEERAARAASK